MWEIAPIMISFLPYLPGGPVCMDDRIHLAMLRSGMLVPKPTAAPQPADPFAGRNAANDVHVVPYGAAWALKLERIPGHRMVQRTQYEAIAAGAGQARAAAVHLVIHGRDGRFREVRDFSLPR